MQTGPSDDPDGVSRTGIYCLGFLYLIMGECPKYEGGSVEYCEYGTDEACTMELSFEAGCKAHADLSVKKVMDRIAVIHGTKGKIELPDFQHAEKYILHVDGKAPEEICIPEGNTAFEHEIEEVVRCIENGQISSDRYQPEMSLSLIRLMDEIRDSWRKQ